MPIDYGPPQGPSRGVTTMAEFRRDGTTGPKVFMYDDNPGVYYDAHGSEIPAVVARAAGFNIEEMEARRSLYSERQRLMSRYAQMVGPKPPRVVEDVRPGGHQLVRIGADVYHIEDKYGQQITSAPLSRYYATIWLDDLDPADEALAEKRAETVDWDKLETAPIPFVRANKEVESASDEGTVGEPSPIVAG